MVAYLDYKCHNIFVVLPNNDWKIMHSSTDQFKPARTREELEAQTDQMEIAIKAAAKHRESLGMQNLMRNTAAAAERTPKAPPVTLEASRPSHPALPTTASHTLPSAGRHYKRQSWLRRLLGS